VKEEVVGKDRVVGKVEVGWEMVAGVRVRGVVGKEVALGRVGRGRAGMVGGREAGYGRHYVASAGAKGEVRASWRTV
jgi:hypothetical protein